MVIASVLVLLAVLMVFLFAYSRMLSSHQLQVKRVQLGVMAGNLAIGAANVCAQLLEKETASIYQELTTGHTSRFAYLIERRLQPGEKVDIPIPPTNFGRYETLARDMIETISLEGQRFKFEGLRMFFQDVSRIVTLESPTFSYTDLLEKQGYLTIEVTVSTTWGGKLTKAARIKRPFKVVSLLPPLLARFSLFVVRSPDGEGYNTVNYDVNTGAAGPQPLQLRNSPTPLVYANPPALPPESYDLQTNGWVYLGPTDDVGNDNVYLNLADGYDAKGQMFLFGKDPGGAIIRYTTKDAPGLRHWINTDPWPVMLFQRFEGISTPQQQTYNSENRFGRSLNPNVSWLQLYGNATGLSRTVVIGPVFGRLLKIMEMGPFGWKPKGSDEIDKITDAGDATRWAWNHKSPVSRAAFNPGSLLPGDIRELYERAKRADADTSHAPRTWGDVFTDAGRYGDYACREVYVPFNQFFDLVKHPTPPTLSLPSWFFLPLDPNDLVYATPGTMRGTLQQIARPPANCAYMARPEHITFGYSQGIDKDFFRFAGDLTTCRRVDIAPVLFEGRATRKCYLTGGSPAAEANALKAQLFGGGRILDMPGIIKIIRDTTAVNPAPLELPADLMNANNTVLVIDRGDVVLDGVSSAGADKHLTIVLLDGSFQVTKKKIQAYLVALKPPLPGRPNVGSIRSRDGRSLDLEGGLAVYELGVPPAGDAGWGQYFREGGAIQYNLTMNPCHYWIKDYYSLFLADASPFVEVVEP